MNTLRVDGLTRALTRQLLNVVFISISLGFIGVLGFCLFFLGFAIKRGISYYPFLGPPGVRRAPDGQTEWYGRLRSKPRDIAPRDEMSRSGATLILILRGSIMTKYIENTVLDKEN